MDSCGEVNESNYNKRQVRNLIIGVQSVIDKGAVIVQQKLALEFEEK